VRKGTVHFPLTKPVPVKLISRIAKLRAAGIAAKPKKPLLAERKKGESRHSRRQSGPSAGGRWCKTVICEKAVSAKLSDWQLHGQEEALRRPPPPQ
jgi:hypothetical protein